MAVNNNEEILGRLVKITEVHEKLINGDKELGIVGLREKQENDEKRNREVVNKIGHLEEKIESIHADIKKEVNDKFEQLNKMVKVFGDWKTGLQESWRRYTSWGFWTKVFILLALAYTLTTKGLPALWEFFIDKITL